MNENQLRNEIKSIIRESLRRKSLRSHVRGIVSEEVKKYLKTKAINEDDEKSTSIKRNAVMDMLKNGKFNHAYLAYQLWNPKDDGEKDTYRSLFSKMATGKPDNDGVVRHFSNEEINKLYELMRKN